MMTETITQKIFEFAYGSGLEDAIRQQAFKSDNKGESTVKKPLRNCEEAKETVKGYVDCILHGQKPNFYEVAKMVEKQFDTYIEDYNRHPEDGKKITGKFRFGNAQKLINMTAKYMFILTYDRPELRERFAQCHCPMDSIMIENVIKGIDECTKLPENIEKLTTRGWKTQLRKPWSQIEYDSPEQYKTFQTLVAFLAKEKYGENTPPIEYDYLEWKSGEKENE